jgi:hypothetical protein
VLDGKEIDEELMLDVVEVWCLFTVRQNLVATHSLRV